MGRTLLYVDPDPATRLLVRKVLEPEGFTVVEADSAREGRESAQRAHPDIILVDVDQVKPADFLVPLREASGMERVAILASTARAWPDDHENAAIWGFERVLLKPLDIDRLAGELGEYLPAAAAPVTAAAAVLAPEPVVTAERAAEPEIGAAGPGAAAAGEAAPAEPVEAIDVRDVPLLWRLNLTPVTESFVRSIPTTHGLTALLDELESALVLVATYSIRVQRAAAAVGTRVPLSLVPWARQVLDTRQPAVLATHALGASPLVPGESTVILVVPIANGDRVHGIAVLGEQRNPKFAPFGPQKISHSMGQARHIATVVEALTQLDAAVRQRRDELHQVRMEMVRTLLGSVKDQLRSRRSRKAEAGRPRRPAPAAAEIDPITRLGLDLGARLGLDPPQREPLRQAIEALDVGRAWVEEMLIPRAAFSEDERVVLLEGCAEHGAGILAALDWPAPVLDLVRAHGAWWNGRGYPAGLAGDDIPLGARVLSVVAAYARATAAEDAAPTPPAILAELRHQAGVRYDPAVVDALAELLATSTR